MNPSTPCYMWASTTQNTVVRSRWSNFIESKKITKIEQSLGHSGCATRHAKQKQTIQLSRWLGPGLYV